MKQEATAGPGLALRAKSAAAFLRDTARGRSLPLAVAAHLDETANYWGAWYPSDPTVLDRTALGIVKVVESHFDRTDKAG